MLTDYNNLAEELRSDTNELETLYTERSQLQEQSKQIAAHIKATGRLLFDARTDLVEQNRIEERLADLETQQRNNAATLGGLTDVLEELEANLHAKLPLACHTFERLLTVLKHTVFTQQQEAIAAFLNPEARETYREQCERLAEHSVAFTELQDIQLPSGGNWGLTRSLDASEADRTARPATMQFVLESTKQPLDNANRIFTEVERYSVEPPEYHLGELEPTPIETVDQNQPLNALNSLSEEEEAFVREFCRESGRDPNNLTDGEKHVLANSLQLWHQARLTGQRRMTIG